MKLGKKGRQRNVNIDPVKRKKLDKKNEAARLKRLQKGQGTGARTKGIITPEKEEKLRVGTVHRSASRRLVEEFTCGKG